MERFDLVVIGAGVAGEAATHYARSKGASVAVIDRALFGGSCPFWACMPSKALLHAAAVHHAGGDYPWKKASDFRDYMINRTKTDVPDDSGHVKSLEDAGATVIRGSATLAGPGRVDIDGRELEAGAIILAIGSVSRVPDLPGPRRSAPMDQRPGHLHPRAAALAGHPRRGADRGRACPGLRAIRRAGHVDPSPRPRARQGAPSARRSSWAPRSSAMA